MRKEVIDYLQNEQKKAEEFGIIPKDASATKPATNRFSGLFRRNVSEVSADVAMATKQANEIVAALTKLLPYFPELKEDIDIFKELIARNSESWQYVEAERATSLKIVLLISKKTINHDEFDGKAVDACLESLSKLRMDDNEQEVVAAISLADKMIGFFEKKVASNSALLIALKETIAEAKRLLAAGRETDEDLESEAPDDVYQLAIDNAKFVINTINNFYNPQNEVAANESAENESAAVADRPSSPPPGLGEISKATVKAPPGLGTGSLPVPPDLPSFLQANTGRVSPPPPPLSPAPPVPQSRVMLTGTPPSGMPEVNHEEVRDRAASSDSSSGIERPPPPIPSQLELEGSDEEIDRASTPSSPDGEGFYESEPEGITEEAMADVTNDKEKELLDSTKKLFNDLANNEGIESDELIAVFEALDADSTPSYWDNLYAAVAGYVFAGPTPISLQNNVGQGIFESDVKKDPKIFEVMLELYKLLDSHSHYQGFVEETISIPGDDNLDKVSLQGLVEAMYPILNSADMTHAARKSELKATTDLRNTSAADRPSQRKVTFDPRIPTTAQQENAKSQSRIRDNKMIEDAWRRVREATSPFDRILLQKHAETLERELEKHYNPDSPFIYETRDSSLSIDSYLGIKDENPLEEDVRSMPAPEDQDEDDANSIPSLESDDDELEHESTELNATVDNDEDRLSHDVQEANPTTPVPEEFWTRPDDTLAEVYLAMLGEDATKGFENYFAREDLHERIKAFIGACETYFDSETPSADDARYLKETFDYALDPINKMIDNNTWDLEGKIGVDYRRELKSYVADQLAVLVSNTLNHTHSRDITREEINGAISLQRMVLAESILTAFNIVESGGGGYCGDRSIIQSMREAIRSGAISISEDHELYTIFQPRDTAGKEQVVSEDDAKEFRKLYVSYLQRANEPYVESLMEAGILNVNLDTVGDQKNVYWLTDIDMKYISKWLKINLNVVQNVGDRDDTYSYKPEVDAESIGTINIFNQGYVNQDGIHYQALLPISRSEFRDSDYVHVDPVTAEGESSSSEFDQIPSEFGASSDEEPLDMNEIVPPEAKTVRGRLTAEQLAAIAGIDQSRREQRRQEESRSPSPSPEEPNATVSNKRRGIFSRLNRVFNNKNASTKTTVESKPNRPVSPLHEELARNQRFQEQQRQENALFGTPSEQRNNDLTDVTPMPPDRNSSGLRRRNRVQQDSTVPTATTNKKPAKTPFAGFVGPAPESLREAVQQNSSENAVPEEQTPVITTQPSTNRTNSSRVEPELPELEEVRAFELDVHAIPRPVAPKSLVAMVRDILDDDNNNTGLDYVDTKIATKIEIVTKGDIPVQVATITDRKYDDPPGKLGTVTASGVSGKDTYDAMSATLKLIAAMPEAERTAYIHPVTVRNITTREQVIGATRALYEYCAAISDAELAADKADALKDIYIIRDGSEAFKQALHEFLNDIPTVYSNEYDQGEYKDFIQGLLKPPTVSMTSGESSRRFRTHPPITPHKQPALPYQPLFGLLDGYTPPKSFMGSMLSGVKRRLTGGPTDDNPKSPRFI